MAAPVLTISFSTSAPRVDVDDCFFGNDRLSLGANVRNLGSGWHLGRSGCKLARTLEQRCG